VSYAGMGMGLTNISEIHELGLNYSPQTTIPVSEAQLSKQLEKLNALVTELIVPIW
jgi:hypothetical protein